jgi:endonuclease/exonuclease/phosphatase family metal-dependent hydrolase
MRCAVPVFFALCLACGAAAQAAERTLRIATFNIAMGFTAAGEMTAALKSGEHDGLSKVAWILQRVRPDIVLLNEFDYDPAADAAGLLAAKYLSQPQGGQVPIDYPYHFRAPVNTGVDSGLDLDGDGARGGAGDAWGFGRFPGQYGMLVLSRFPVVSGHTRTFQNLRWSDLPGAHAPHNPDGSAFYPPAVWASLRLSSKSHWDVVLDIEGVELHLLAHHPTPPVFDGPEDRNGRRNFDEIRFWKLYREAGDAAWLLDDQGRAGGIDPSARFVIAGDFNADPLDGDSLPGAIGQLLDADWLGPDCPPASSGGREAALRQGGVNAQQRGDPALDTADFDDRYTGNLRLDYVLPSANLETVACGVFWPAAGEAGAVEATVSDHRLVWLDIHL